MNPFEIFKQKPDKAPFKKWKSSDLNGKGGERAEFFELPEHPELVIRKFSEFDTVSNSKRKLTTTEAVQHWSERAKALEEFANRYGIKMAKTRYFFGNDPKFKTIIPKASSPALMAITDRITGKNLEEINTLDEKVANEIDIMFSKLFSGLLDSYEKDNYWWRDYGNKQMMYGTAPEETESHVYLVDVDPRITKWSESLPREQEYIFWRDADWVFNEMRDLEKKYANDTKPFKNARKALSELIAKKSVPVNETAVDLREQLIAKIKN